MKKVLILILTFVMCLPMASCETIQKKEFKAYYFDWFDTVTIISGYEKYKDDFDKVVKEIEKSFDKYHKLYNIYQKYDGYNNLAVVNEKTNDMHNTVKVDSEIIELLEFSKSIYNLTGGRFNIAMGSVLSIWHTYREIGMSEPNNAELPPMEKLRKAYSNTDIDDVIIDNEKGTVFISNPELTLDVGAIAKGFACEQISKKLKKMGVTGYVINAGGNVCTIGTKPNGKPWSIGVENPDKENKEKPYIAYLELKGQSLVTSGNYQRYYTVNGEKYHHIIDPDTLMPSKKYISVSVLSNNSGLADALSTALFNMPIEEGFEIINDMENVEAMWVLPSGEIEYSNGFKKYLSK